MGETINIRKKVNAENKNRHSYAKNQMTEELIILNLCCAPTVMVYLFINYNEIRLTNTYRKEKRGID